MRAQSATRMREHMAPKPNAQAKESPCSAFAPMRSASAPAFVVLRLGAHAGAERRQRPKGGRAGAGSEARWGSDGPFNAAALIVSEQSSMCVWSAACVCGCCLLVAAAALRLFFPCASLISPPSHRTRHTTQHTQRGMNTRGDTHRRVSYDGMVRLVSRHCACPLSLSQDPAT